MFHQGATFFEKRETDRKRADGHNPHTEEGGATMQDMMTSRALLRLIYRIVLQRRRSADKNDPWDSPRELVNCTAVEDRQGAAPLHRRRHSVLTLSLAGKSVFHINRRIPIIPGLCIFPYCVLYHNRVSEYPARYANLSSLLHSYGDIVASRGTSRAMISLLILLGMITMGYVAAVFSDLLAYKLHKQILKRNKRVVAFLAGVGKARNIAVEKAKEKTGLFRYIAKKCDF